MSTPRPRAVEPVALSQRRPTRGMRFRHRLGVFLLAAAVVAFVVGVSFLVGYIVGKILL